MVPEPKKLSNTISPGLLPKVKTLSIRRSGLGVSNNVSKSNVLISVLASLVVPTSSANQIVSGTLPF